MPDDSSGATPDSLDLLDSMSERDGRQCQLLLFGVLEVAEVLSPVAGGMLLGAVEPQSLEGGLRESTWRSGHRAGNVVPPVMKDGQGNRRSPVI